MAGKSIPHEVGNELVRLAADTITEGIEQATGGIIKSNPIKSQKKGKNPLDEESLDEKIKRLKEQDEQEKKGKIPNIKLMLKQQEEEKKHISEEEERRRIQEMQQAEQKKREKEEEEERNKSAQDALAATGSSHHTPGLIQRKTKEQIGKKGY